jgi:hypothetical protein
VSVIALLVSRLDKDSHLTELARKLALDISKQVRHHRKFCKLMSSSNTFGYRALWLVFTLQCLHMLAADISK